VQSAPDTFNFLGFTHVCGKSRSGRYLLLRLTVKDRMRAKLKSIREDLLRRRHLPVAVQGEWRGAARAFERRGVPTAIFKSVRKRNRAGGATLRSGTVSLTIAV
jgi:RNA-directed DNA polymerase